MKRHLYLSGILILVSCIGLFGCSQEADKDKDLDSVLDSSASDGPAQQFNFSKLYMMFPKKSEEAELTLKAQEIIDNRENPQGRLPEAIAMLRKVLGKLPKKSYGDCQKEALKAVNPPSGVCNQWASIHSKIAEAYFFSGELAVSNPQAQVANYRQGADEGKEAINYNPKNVAALFTTGVNLGSWLGVSYEKIWTGWLDRYENQETLENTPKRVERLLMTAERRSPHFYNGMVQLSLGRLYYKVDPKYLTRGGPSLAETYLKTGLERDPVLHYGHLYFFEFFRDNKRMSEAINEGKWLITNAENPQFSKKFPITARMEKKEALEFLNSH